MAFQRPIKVFCAYSHKDAWYLDRLHVALKVWVSKGHLELWADIKIPAGEDWSQHIDDRAHKAHLFLLLVSDYFMASNYCFGIELAIATERYEKGEAAVVPIIVRPANWEMIEELARFQALPPRGDYAGRREAVWKQVSAGILKTVDDLCSGSFVFRRRVLAAEPVPDLLPFLCGRSKEQEQFHTALKNAPRHRPFVCILFGDDRQGHRGFTDRLEASSIKDILNVTSGHAVYHPEPDLYWSRFDTEPDFESAFSTELAASLDPRPACASREAIAQSIRSHPGLTVVRSVLAASDWQPGSESQLRAFVRYWQTWPDLLPGQPLIVFLNIKLSANRTMAESPERIPEGQSLVKIPLRCVPFNDVEAWLDDPNLQKSFDAKKIAADLTAIFNTEDCIPMEDLAEKLRLLLSRHRI